MIEPGLAYAGLGIDEDELLFAAHIVAIPKPWLILEPVRRDPVFKDFVGKAPTQGGAALVIGLGPLIVGAGGDSADDGTEEAEGNKSVDRSRFHHLFSLGLQQEVMDLAA